MVQYELHPLLSSDSPSLAKHVAWDVIKNKDADPNFWHILAGCYTIKLVSGHAFWQDIQWYVFFRLLIVAARVSHDAVI